MIALACDRDGVTGRLGEDEDTIFWLASMTKPIVAVGALKLVERGLLDLDEPVGNLMPLFDELPVLEGFEGDLPVVREHAVRATIRHLLVHTAGLGYWWASEDLVRYHELTGVPTPASGELAMFEAPLLFDPGTDFAYGTGYDWLGRVIETVTGQDLATYLEREVLAPLGMADTAFSLTDAQRARLAPMRRRSPDGELAEIPFDSSSPREYWSGGAGLYGTAGDYARFVRALLRGGELDGERVLRADTVDLAFTDQLDGVPLPEEIPTAIPALSNDVHFPPVARGWGLGFHLVLEDVPGMRRAGSGDRAGLANTYFWADRHAGVGGVLLDANLPFHDAQVLAAFAGFEAAVYAGALSGAAATRPSG